MLGDIETKTPRIAIQPEGVSVWAAIAAHPDLLSAAREVTALQLAHVQKLPPAMRWLFGDMGRTALTITAAVLEDHPGGLTLSNFYRVARRNGICSAGRVIQYYDTAVAKGWFRPGDNSRRKVKQLVTLSGEFKATMRPIITSSVIGLRRLGMCNDAAVAWAHQPENLHAVCPCIGYAAEALIEPVPGPQAPISTMTALEGGVRVLEALTATQFMADEPGAGWRGTRQDLADTCGISRTQLKRVLTTGVECGLLTVDDCEVRVSPLMIDVVRHEYAYFMAIAHSVLRLCLGTTPEDVAARERVRHLRPPAGRGPVRFPFAREAA